MFASSGYLVNKTSSIKAEIKSTMTLNIKDFQWIREPESWVINNDTIEVVTKAHTDLWQRPYYHFRNDNAPVFQMKTREKLFSFIVKTECAWKAHDGQQPD